MEQVLSRKRPVPLPPPAAYVADDLVTEKEACAIIGGRHTPLHRSSLWRGIRSGRYPPPLKVGPNGKTNRWIFGELAAVRDAAMAEREAS